MWHVYQIKNLINGKSYVGLTKNLRLRKWTHSRGDPKCKAIGGAIKKYGWDKFQFIVLDVYDSVDTACFAERHYIQNLGTKVPTGYNIADGGEGAVGAPHSEEARRKVSAALKGRDAYWLRGPRSPEQRAAMSAARHAHYTKYPEKRAKSCEISRQVQLRRWERHKDNKLEFGRALHAASVAALREKRKDPAFEEQFRARMRRNAQLAAAARIAKAAARKKDGAIM